MKKILFLILAIFFSSNLQANGNFTFFLEKAIKNNLKLNAERKNLQSIKQSQNISKSEFFPNLTISGNQTSTTSSNRINQNGASLADTNLDSENKTISIEQKLFSGLKGLNTFKKSELENQKANLELNQVEQETILDTAKLTLIIFINLKMKNLILQMSIYLKGKLNQITQDYKKADYINRFSAIRVLISCCKCKLNKS